MLILTMFMLTSCKETDTTVLADFTSADFPIVVNSDCPLLGVCDSVEQAIENFNEQAGFEVFQIELFDQVSSIQIEWYIEDLEENINFESYQTREPDRVLIEINESSFGNDYCLVMHELGHALGFEDINDQPNMMSEEPECDTRSAENDYNNDYFELFFEQFEEFYNLDDYLNN